MVQFIQGGPTFGEQMAASIGKGTQSLVDQLGQMALEKQKQSRLGELLSLGMNAPRGEGMESFAQPFNFADLPSSSKLALAQEFPQIIPLITSAERLQATREKTAEPELNKMQEELRSYESSGLGFSRLAELSSPEFESKFPPALLASIFTKDGNINPVAASQMSPEAQEYVKLLSDQLSGAKATFGARVTNFDLESYMKRLPSLINTPEGRRKVLRDLQIMNSLNIMEHRGVIDIMDKYGGPGKISLSKAKRIFDKENASKIAEARKEFIRPGSTEIKSLDSWSASLHSGQVIEDEETGERFRSNGFEWVPL